MRQEISRSTTISFATYVIAFLLFFTANAFSQNLESKKPVTNPSEESIEQSNQNSGLQGKAGDSSVIIDSNKKGNNASDPSDSVLKKASSISKTMDQSIKDSIDKLFSNKFSSSIFFDAKQLSKIRKAISAHKRNEVYIPEDYIAKGDDAEKSPDESPIPMFLKVSSIIYLSQKNWSVWIGGKKYTQKTNDKNNEIFIEKVDEQSVMFLWKIRATKLRTSLGISNLPPDLITDEDGFVKRHFKLMQNQYCSILYSKPAGSQNELLSRTSGFLSSLATNSDRDRNLKTSQADNLNIGTPTNLSSQANSGQQNVITALGSTDGNQVVDSSRFSSPSNTGQSISNQTTAGTSQNKDVKSQIENKISDLINTPQSNPSTQP